MYVTNWDDADEALRDSAQEVFARQTALHKPTACAIDEWTWLEEEHDPARPHMQKIHFGVPGVLDAIKEVYGEISRIAPQLEITGQVEERVPLGYVGGFSIGPLDFRDPSISPDAVCDVEETRCMFWSPAGVVGLAGNQDGEFGSTEGFDEAVERFCAPALDGLPRVFRVKGKKLKEGNFMEPGTPLSLSAKIDARNGEFFAEHFWLPEDMEDRFGFVSFAGFYRLGSESVYGSTYGKPGSLFAGLIGPNGKSAGRIDAGCEADRMLALCVDELACFTVSNDPYAVVVDRVPGAKPDVPGVGYQFKVAAKHIAKNGYGSLAEYDNAHPERGACAVVKAFLEDEIPETK